MEVLAWLQRETLWTDSKRLGVDICVVALLTQMSSWPHCPAHHLAGGSLAQQLSSCQRKSQVRKAMAQQPWNQAGPLYGNCRGSDGCTHLSS